MSNQKEKRMPNKDGTWPQVEIILPVPLLNLPLPEGWERRESRDGKVFFLNVKTRKTQWEVPLGDIKEDQEIEEDNASLTSSTSTNFSSDSN